MLGNSVAVVVRTRPRAIPLAMITMRKSTNGFPFLSYMSMGLRLVALRAAGAPLQKGQGGHGLPRIPPWLRPWSGCLPLSHKIISVTESRFKANRMVLFQKIHWETVQSKFGGATLFRFGTERRKFELMMIIFFENTTFTKSQGFTTEGSSQAKTIDEKYSFLMKV